MDDYNQLDQDIYLECLDWKEPEEIDWKQPYSPHEVNWWDPPRDDAYAIEDDNRKTPAQICSRILNTLEKRLCERGVTVTDFFDYLKFECGQAGQYLNEQHWGFLVRRLNFIASDHELFEKLCVATKQRKAKEIDIIIHIANEYMCELWNCGIEFVDTPTYNATYIQAIMRFASRRGISLTSGEMKVIKNKYVDDDNVQENAPEGTSAVSTIV